MAYDDAELGMPIPTWLLFELVEGQTLQSRLAAEPLPAMQLTNIAKQLVEGVAFIASQGLIHGELTSKNILLTAEQDVKIGGLGLSSLLRGVAKQAGTNRLFSYSHQGNTCSMC